MGGVAKCLENVMAKILVKLTRKAKVVVPFLVVDCPEELMKTAQVNFMIEKNWLSKRNVLSWNKLKKILGTDTAIHGKR